MVKVVDQNEEMFKFITRLRNFVIESKNEGYSQITLQVDDLMKVFDIALKDFGEEIINKSSSIGKN